MPEAGQRDRARNHDRTVLVLHLPPAMTTEERYTAGLQIPLGDANYSLPRTSVKIEGPTHGGGPDSLAIYLVLESASEDSLDEAKLNLAELAGRITKALDAEFGYRR